MNHLTTTHCKTLVTVTTVCGKPTFEMPDKPNRRQIDAAVLEKYGYHLVDPRVSALRHGYYTRVCGDDQAAARALSTVGPFGHRGEVLARSERRLHTGC